MKRSRSPLPTDSSPSRSTSDGSTHSSTSIEPPPEKRQRIDTSLPWKFGETEPVVDTDAVEGTKDSESLDGPHPDKTSVCTTFTWNVPQRKPPIYEDLTPSLASILPPPVTPSAAQPAPSPPLPEFEVRFRVLHPHLADEEDERDRSSPYIHLADPTRDFSYLSSPDEIVIRADTLEIVYTYPLRLDAHFSRSLESRNGVVTRKELALLICTDYQKIYEEEGMESGPQDHTVMLMMAGRMDEVLARKERNERRERTDKYGIWGHCLGDLDLCGVRVAMTMEGEGEGEGSKAVCKLSVDS